MALFGILKQGGDNTGLDTELDIVFSTPLSINSNQPVLAADTLSLKRKTMGQRAQRWEITTNICPTVGSNNYLIHSVFNGHDKTFMVRMPQIPKTKYSEEVLFVNGDYNKGDITIDYSPETTGDLLSGEFISFGDSHKKVYLVLDADPLLDRVTIFPPLVNAIADGESVYHGSRVTLHTKNETTTAIGMTFIDGLLMDPGSVVLIEDLNTSIE